MKILILCPNYFPIENPRAFRWQAIAEHWAKDHQVTVICASAKYVPSEERKNGVSIYRRGYNNLMDFLYNLLDIKQRRDRTIKENTNKSSGRLERIISFLNKIFWHSLYWPDGSFIWYFPALNQAKKLLHEEKYDLLISVSVPFTSHLVAKKLRQIFPEIKWSVDIGDPFAFHSILPWNNERLYKKLNFKAEANILKKCDHIFLTHNNALTTYEKYFFPIKHKTTITPPIFIPPNQMVSSAKIKLSSNKINIGYFGTFYKNIRTPQHLLQFIGQVRQKNQVLLSQIHFHFFGYISPDIQLQFDQYQELSPYFTLHGFQSKNSLWSIFPQIDFLLNISNLTHFQIPSKVAEYIYIGIPIINIIYHDKDLFASAIVDHPMHINLKLSKHSDFERNERAFQLFIQKNYQKKLSSKQIEMLIAPYSIEQIAKAYLSPISLDRD